MMPTAVAAAARGIALSEATVANLDALDVKLPAAELDDGGSRG